MGLISVTYSDATLTVPVGMFRAIPCDGPCLSSSSHFSPSAACPARPHTSSPGSDTSLCAFCPAGPWEGRGLGMRSGS